MRLNAVGRNLEFDATVFKMKSFIVLDSRNVYTFGMGAHDISVLKCIYAVLKSHI